MLAGSIESTEHCRKFIQKVDDDLVTSADGLDPIDDFNLDYIFGRLMRHGGVEGEVIEYVRMKEASQYLSLFSMPL